MEVREQWRHGLTGSGAAHTGTGSGAAHTGTAVGSGQDITGLTGISRILIRVER